MIYFLILLVVFVVLDAFYAVMANNPKDGDEDNGFL